MVHKNYWPKPMHVICRELISRETRLIYLKLPMSQLPAKFQLLSCLLLSSLSRKRDVSPTYASRYPSRCYHRMTADPTVLIVHGAFHLPQHFVHLASLLQQAGCRVEVPALPSVGIEQDPGNALELDARSLCEKLGKLVVEEKRDVVVLMHSYGGQVLLKSYVSFKRRGKMDLIFFLFPFPFGRRQGSYSMF